MKTKPYEKNESDFDEAEYYEEDRAEIGGKEIDVEDETRDDDKNEEMEERDDRSSISST